MTARKNLFQFGYARHPDQDADRAGASSGDRGRRGPGRHDARARSGAARSAAAAARRRRPDRRGQSRRSAFPSARSRSSTGSASAEPMVDKGVVWRVGKVFLGDSQVYEFDLLPEGGHKLPAFINLQQYYVEQYLVERIGELPRHRPALAQQGDGLEPRNDDVALTIETPEGPYRLSLRLARVPATARARRLRAHAGLGLRRRGVRGPVPDRRREDDGATFRPSAGSGSIRRSTPASRRCCTAARRCLAHRPAARTGGRCRGRAAAGERAAAHRAHARPRQVRCSSGFRSTNSSAGGWTSSSMAG